MWKDEGTICNWLGRLKYESNRDGRFRITDLETNEAHEFADGHAAAKWALDRASDGRHKKYEAEQN